MSLLDKASLIVTPNAYKESKLYSVVPSSGAGDMSVVRATTATRVNSAGLIEIVPKNLVTYSNNFSDGAWEKQSSSVNDNVIVSPDGTQNASKFIATATNAFHAIWNGLNTYTGTFTFSVYAKKGEYNFLILQDQFSGTFACGFNLNTGVVAFGSNTTIESVGNGWYRCSVRFTASAQDVIPTITISPTTSAGYLGNGTSGGYIWHAQLENFATATEYFPTTTRLNIPRIDYTNGSCPSLLVEPQRTNDALYSEQFDNAAWAKYNATVTANNVISPDGTQNADRVVFTTDGYLYQEKAITGWASATLSIYTKTTTQKIVFGGATPAGTDTYSTINVGNGWYRQILKRTFTISGTGLLQILPIGSNETLYFWGCQVEQGSYATSYVPTVASSVTRNADVISKTGISSLIGQTEGTMFLDIKAQLNTADEQDFSISDGTTNNRVIIRITSTGVIRGIGVFAGNVEFNIGGTSYTSGNRYKIALAYKNNDVVLYINGTSAASTSTTTISGTLSRLGFDVFTNGAQIIVSPVNSAQLYKTKLSNTELAQLTTL